MKRQHFVEGTKNLAEVRKVCPWAKAFAAREHGTYAFDSVATLEDFVKGEAEEKARRDAAHAHTRND